MPEAWPSGHRYVHHGFLGRLTQRAIALLYRDHHTEDEHTEDGHYAANDEAFSRLEALERPSPEARLDMLRKRAKAQKLRRQYRREANWLAANGQHQHYQRLLLLHERYPDQHEKPSSVGLDLTDEDKARIGPTDRDIHIECDNRIDDLRPRFEEMFARWIARNKGLEDLKARHYVMARERSRAALLAALPEVRDDYFEPKYWAEGFDEALREYVRLACLGAPEDPENLDAWHIAARAGLELASEDGDLIAVCALLRSARDHDDVDAWDDPPSTLPAVSVKVEGETVTVTPAAALPSRVQVVASYAVVNSYDLSFLDSGSDSGSEEFTITPGQTGRIAVLIRYARSPDQPGAVPVRTIGGGVAFVGAIG